MMNKLALSSEASQTLKYDIISKGKPMS